MTLQTLLNEIDKCNDSYEDIYNQSLHNLGKEDGNMTIKDFLASILKEIKGESMKTRRVEKPKTCCCGTKTYKQVYDFKNAVWVYYCDICQEPIDDKNA
jgi:hypothetical protein